MPGDASQKVTREVTGGGSSPPFQTPGRSGSESESAFCLGAQGLGPAPKRRYGGKQGLKTAWTPTSPPGRIQRGGSGTLGGTRVGIAPSGQGPAGLSVQKGPRGLRWSGSRGSRRPLCATPGDPEFRALPANPPQTQPDMTPGAGPRRAGRSHPVHLGPELGGGPTWGAHTHCGAGRPPSSAWPDWGSGLARAPPT